MDKWMSKLPETLTKVPLTKISIPGTHDSCSYCLNNECEISLDNEAFPILKLLGRIGKGIAARWGRTQDGNLSEQLSAGIRYLDLRVIRHDADGLFYFVHGQFAKEVSVELTTIHSFLRDHPKEVVLLDFNHLYCFSHPYSTPFLEHIIVKVFGSMLAPRSEHIPSLTELWMGGFQVICFLSEPTESPVMWDSKNISSSWPNTVLPDKLIEFLDSHPPQDSNIFHVTQCILTPDKEYVLSNLNSGLPALAATAGEKVFEWLNRKTEKLNIVIIDFAVKMFPQFVSTVITRNI